MHFLLSNADGGTPHVGIILIPTISLRFYLAVIPVFELDDQDVAVSNDNQVKFTLVTLRINEPKASVSLPRKHAFEP